MRKKNKKKANFLRHGITFLQPRCLHNRNFKKCIIFPCILGNTHCSSSFFTFLSHFLLLLIHVCNFIELNIVTCISFGYSASVDRLCWQHLLWTAGTFQLWHTVTAPVHTSSTRTPSPVCPSTLWCALFWKHLAWIKSPKMFPWTSIWNSEGCHHADSYRFIGEQFCGLAIQQPCWELAC